MRVTSQTFPNQLKDTTSTLLSRENKLSQQISTGMNILDPSDNVAGFGDLNNYRTNELQTQQYSANTDSATLAAQNSYQGMADLQTLMSRASELITSANGVSDASTYHIIGQEMGTIADQIASIANRSTNGVYLYGSTGNVPPLVSNPSAPPSYVFNSSANYSSNVTSYEINANLSVNIGLTAGSSTAGFNGFLYKAGQTSTDTYTLIASLATEMQNATSTADPFAAEGGYASAMQQVNAAVSLSSESVGIASAKLTQLSTNATALTNQMTNLRKQASTLSDANTANLATDLTTVQTAYQAALQSGAKILNMSLLDYIT
ncbi:Flagellin FlgL [Verrucomicrobium sp. GAS474]|uniref:hypothetical protein n=1 Tax=Verrucomicrobium sp. GAS474 TaxID=1882831 RepID=UPI00087D5E15|nr:hypothetical protein [Verrucomicrobium sp. GAS474]SDU24566.1 Flagellin FlgL [Verrucomicrobium sp. GAS474]